MATPAYAPNLFGTVDGGVAATPRPKYAADPTRSVRGLDEQLAPLRIPALVLGTLLICLGVAALVPLRAWLHDYGGWLVVAAYLQYMGIAVTLGVWGLRTTRRGESAAEGSAQHVLDEVDGSHGAAVGSSVVPTAAPSGGQPPRR